MPASVPRQPQWTAAMTPRSASAISTGAQSAVSTPMVNPDVVVTTASASGGSVGDQGPVAVNTRALCVCLGVLGKVALGAIRSATRRRFSATDGASSFDPNPQFREL